MLQILQFIVVMIAVTLLKWLGILQRNPTPAQQILPISDTAVTLHLPEVLLAFAHAQPSMVAAPQPPATAPRSLQHITFLCPAAALQGTT